MQLTKVEKQQYRIIIVSIYIFIFHDLFTQLFNLKALDYVDDSVGILLFIFYLYYSLLKKNINLYKSIVMYLILICIICICGLYSNIKYKLQVTDAVIIDIIAFIKFFMAFISYYLILHNFDLEKLERKIAKHIVSINSIILVMFVIDYIFAIFPKEQRWGFHVVSLFYGHSTSFGDICIVLLTLTMYLKKHIKNNMFFICGLSFCLISTVRLKIIACLILVLIINVMIVKYRKKITITRGLIISIIAIVVAWRQIIVYFFSDEVETARHALLVSSFKIAKDYFPLGTGFGTFASSASEKFYSKVYYMYNLTNVYGLNGENTKYISDIFWPTIIGEIGVTGLCIYLIILTILFFQIQKLYKKNRNKYFVAIYIYVYMIASSLSTSAFLSANGIIMAFILGMFLSSKNSCLELYQKKQYEFSC